MLDLQENQVISYKQRYYTKFLGFQHQSEVHQFLAEVLISLIMSRSFCDYQPLKERRYDDFHQCTYRDCGGSLFYNHFYFEDLKPMLGKLTLTKPTQSSVYFTLRHLAYFFFDRITVRGRNIDLGDIDGEFVVSADELLEVDDLTVRKEFPESWIWHNIYTGFVFMFLIYDRGTSFLV